MEVRQKVDASTAKFQAQARTLLSTVKHMNVEEKESNQMRKCCRLHTNRTDWSQIRELRSVELNSLEEEEEVELDKNLENIAQDPAEEEDTNLSATRLIHLNVGGKCFATTEDVLTSSPNIISCMLNNNNNFHIERDSQGRIFFDRDSISFRIILNFLRDCNSSLPEVNSYDFKQLEVEARYFGVSELVDRIEEEKKKDEDKKSIFRLPSPNKYYRAMGSTLERILLEETLESTSGVNVTNNVPQLVRVKPQLTFTQQKLTAMLGVRITRAKEIKYEEDGIGFLHIRAPRDKENVTSLTSSYPSSTTSSLVVLAGGDVIVNGNLMAKLPYFWFEQTVVLFVFDYSRRTVEIRIDEDLYIEVFWEDWEGDELESFVSLSLPENAIDIIQERN